MFLLSYIWRFLLVLLFGFSFVGVVWSQEAFVTDAEFAILQDFETGEILYEKHADARMYPASMTKIMTTYVLFDELASGRLSLTDEFSVSAKARRIGGSRMFLEQGSRVSVEDILRGIVVQSGNDASIAVAENIGGSEDLFAEIMNEKARDLGMVGSHFVNASGWPDEEHYTTARDLLVLTRRTIADFPQFYPYYAERSFTYNGIKQGNRNPLLYRDIGVDGLKTGHTVVSGYGLAASAFVGDRRLLMVINGLASVEDRASESRRLLEWGYRAFDNYSLLNSGDVVGFGEVWLGRESEVSLRVGDDILLTLAKHKRKDLRGELVYDSPLLAPVTEGQEVGVLRLIGGSGDVIGEFPLYTGESVVRLSFFEKLPLLVDFLVSGGS